MMGPKAREAAARFVERRKREDDARRLVDEVPALASLRVVIEERRAGVVGVESKHTRIVIVERAPALFAFACGDPSCDGGGYEMTEPMMRELRARKPEVVVERECHGNVGNVPCGRVARATATATYR